MLAYYGERFHRYPVAHTTSDVFEVTVEPLMSSAFSFSLCVFSFFYFRMLRLATCTSLYILKFQSLHRFAI
jgi:hypothetical protein